MRDEASLDTVIPRQADGDSQRITVPARARYPWFSLLLALLVVAYYLLVNQPALAAFYQLPLPVSAFSLQASVAAFFAVMVLLDVRRCQRGRKKLEQQFKALNAEIDELWASKKKIRARAHAYSGQADKLKLFISDKLLEYIEYDEKFLHFKNIASEVRHNGVISYDKVRTALSLAAEASHDADDEPGQDARASAAGLLSTNVYREALDSMRYLWDLLDLSTTDNIALHIGNYLIECEEHYYQAMLNKEGAAEGIEQAPFTPHFSPNTALVKLMLSMLDGAEKEALVNQCYVAHQAGEKRVAHACNQFRVDIEEAPALLGNENHFILLLENLIKNAQFFSGKSRKKQESDRVALKLRSRSGFVQLEIYNRGPHISEQDIDQVFQLGFSTRRVKEHHGKGLGLFFVNEIVKGYQGSIDINNVVNQPDSYSIRIALANGEVVTRIVNASLESGRLCFHESAVEGHVRQLSWSFSEKISSIEVSSGRRATARIFDQFDNKKISRFLDPDKPLMPQWSIEVKPKRGDHQVRFNALDIAGVQFVIKLPTADSRLKEENPIFEADFDVEVEQLNERFKEFDDF